MKKIIFFTLFSIILCGCTERELKVEIHSNDIDKQLIFYAEGGQLIEQFDCAYSLEFSSHDDSWFKYTTEYDGNTYIVKVIAEENQTGEIRQGHIHAVGVDPDGDSKYTKVTIMIAQVGVYLNN